MTWRARRRLLEHLEQRVGGIPAQRLGAGDDEHLAARLEGRGLGYVHERLRGVNGGGDLRIALQNAKVGMEAFASRSPGQPIARSDGSARKGAPADPPGRAGCAPTRAPPRSERTAAVLRRVLCRRDGKLHAAVEDHRRIEPSLARQFQRRGNAAPQRTARSSHDSRQGFDEPGERRAHRLRGRFLVAAGVDHRYPLGLARRRSRDTRRAPARRTPGPRRRGGRRRRAWRRWRAIDRRHVEQQGEVRPAATGGQPVDLGDQVARDTTAISLIGHRRVGEAVAQNVHPAPPAPGRSPPPDAAGGWRTPAAFRRRLRSRRNGDRGTGCGSPRRAACRPARGSLRRPTRPRATTARRDASGWISHCRRVPRR